VKLVTSLLRNNFLLMVLIMSCGLLKGRIFSTSGKRCVERIANMRERCVQVLVCRLNAKGLFVRSSRRWQGNIKMVLQRVGWGRGLKLCAS
jgi:hypothetical protein